MNFLIAIIATTALHAAVPAKPIMLKPEKGTVTFHAEAGPGNLIKIEGTGAHLQGLASDSGTSVSGVFSVTLADLTTSNSLRDDHMKNKYLEVGKYPKATLILDQTTYEENKDFPWSGTLQIKNDRHLVNGHAIIRAASGARMFAANFTISLKDFPAIGAPEWKAVGVDDAVKIDIEQGL